MHLNILTPGPQSYNARAFLHPITMNRQLLRDASIEIHYYKKIENVLTDCDVLIIDSKYFKYWYQDEKKLESMYQNLESFSKKTKVLFFDTTDSAGYVLGDVLPFVDGYFKHQLLIDKTAYLKPMYGRRAFSDFYHKENNVKDDKIYEENITQVNDPLDLEKLDVFWNTGLANYSYLGDYLGKVYKRCLIDSLVRYPVNYTKPSRDRFLDIQCRVNTSYSKASVSFQRKSIVEILKDRLQTKKLNRFAFYREMKNSKIVLSPFGLGEITLKDFETFICGAVLMKPDMSHMYTWPNFYQKDISYLSFDWDLKNLDEKIELVLSDRYSLVSIAEEGQKIYRYYLGNDRSKEFVNRFKHLLLGA